VQPRGDGSCEHVLILPIRSTTALVLLGPTSSLETAGPPSSTRRIGNSLTKQHLSHWRFPSGSNGPLTDARVDPSRHDEEREMHGH
jgi:hypothetical protein